VSLEVAANDRMDDAAKPKFIGVATEKVAAGAASFPDLVVEWDKPLAPEGEQVTVAAHLLVGNNSECKGHTNGVLGRHRNGRFNQRRGEFIHPKEVQ